MSDSKPSLILRDDTFFGVCEGLGEDFGFDPTYLRIVVAVSILFNPALAAAAYVAGGVVVAVARFVYPAVSKAERPAEPAAAAPSCSNDDQHEIAYAKAA